MNSKIRIREVPFGIASRVGNTIYVHKDIKGFSEELYRALIAHELAHSDTYTMKDLIMDISIDTLYDYKKDYYKFILTHPSALTELLPFWKYEGKFQLNATLLLLYASLLGLFIMFLWIG